MVATGGLGAPLVDIWGLSSAVGVARNTFDAKKSKKENEELRKSNLDSAVKQKVIEKFTRELKKYNMN